MDKLDKVIHGIVSEYNGRFGYIISDDNVRYDFAKDEISLVKPIQPDDSVIFRGEDHGRELKLARNILKR